jgi:hypothetical protein
MGSQGLHFKSVFFLPGLRLDEKTLAELPNRMAYGNSG